MTAGTHGHLPFVHDLAADIHEIHAPACCLWHGGDFYEVTPQGEVVWRYQGPRAHHHDAQWLPNAILLYAACAPVSRAVFSRIACRAGTAHWSPKKRCYGDVIREVNRAGELVWEWKAWEHLNPKDLSYRARLRAAHHWPLVKPGSVL
ncbi:hypothetical protein ACFFYR_24460 [Paraburkholderia dipogonis]|uniref:hypothetical protein n=1 Tax=Paraburkholderia dipogonis TaxID=1211383 RepID=UPI0035E5CA8E